VLTISSNDSVTSQPIDGAQFFVRQHYRDFLNREPDPAGLNFWTNEITSCGTDAQCIEIKRINVSAAFFLSIEFQETGYLAYRFYNAALNRANGLPRYLELMRDTQAVGRGIVVGAPGWEAQLESNKVAYANEFVSRSEFMTLYPASLSPTQFVDSLYAHAGITPSAQERQAAIDEFNNPSGARGRVLRRVADNQDLKNRESNRAFVLMEYFGYLRRNPDDPPDNNLGGYNFWLNKLNQFNGNFIEAEMVKAFITSTEYRQRFGPSGESPNNTRVQPGTQIVDSNGDVWTRSNDGSILRNGAGTGGVGSQILYCNHIVYVFGTDSQWWQWTNGWIPAGSTDPCAGPSGESPNNTRVQPGTQIVDSNGDVWTRSNDGSILRNGAGTGGVGSQILYCNHIVYVFGTDSQWWRWSNGWIPVGSTDPCAG
jgi:hypothetical protein